MFSTCKKMNIAILLPLKEKYTKISSGAVSLMVNSHLQNSKFRQTTKIYGSENKKMLDKKNFIPITSNKFFFTNFFYVKSFEKMIDPKTEIIEIHNRPKYFFKLKKNFPHIKFCLFFHNNPLDLIGSKSIRERKYLYKKADKLVFLSFWMKNKFFKGFRTSNNKKIKIFYPGVKSIKNFPSKKNIILFVGKLNEAKGFHIFQKALSKFVLKNKSWRAIAVGIEPRREILPNENILELGEVSNKKVLNLISDSKITVACSCWDEPLGRLPIESSSRGSFPVVSNKGGLTETLSNSFSILKKNNSEELLKKIEFLSNNPSTLLKFQKKVFMNFKLSLKNTTEKLDCIRLSLFEK